MQVWWTYEPRSTTAGSPHGKSPLAARVPVFEFTDKRGVPRCPGKCLTSTHQPFTADSQAGPTLGDGLGWDQRYDDFVTAFYHGPLPNTFTALRDEP